VEAAERPIGDTPHPPLVAGLGLLCRHMCGDSHMATNLSIDPDLIEQALEVSG
jgi:hypothetical protein